MIASIPVLPALMVVTAMFAVRMEDEEKGYIGVAIKAGDNGGVVINEVRDESPAMKAGLKENDRIIKVGGEAVASLQGFVEKIRGTKPGPN